MTGTIILEVPGDKERNKIPVLTARLAQALDPATVRVMARSRTADLRVVEIDISVAKKEFRNTLAGAGDVGLWSCK